MQEDPNRITYFAQTNARGKEVSFGIKRLDRARHMYIIGKTGMGKSTVLENMAIQDIRNGEGMAFIDPHGSTADRIMEYVPERRIKDVVYFAPFDMEYPIAFNVMEDVGYDKRHLVVSGLLSAFRKIWVDAWSARMEYILSNTLLALLEYEGSTLLDVNRMLINKSFRKKVVDNVTDPIVKSFWVDEFANYTDRYTQDATPAIQNKVGQFTSNPLIRNIVGQPKSSFDIRKMMDEKKILIINLSKGRVGEVNATLLGSMLVTKIYLAAMSRADVPANIMADLPSFYLYVDEFQNFANESFSDILSEARKYKLRLIIAHQYIEQMEEEVRDAVFGNVGTTVTFRVGPFDAEVLETVFSPQFMATDLVNLGFAQIYLTLMIDGVGSQPFSATTLPPFDPPPEIYTEAVIANSRAQFAKARATVEAEIAKWHEADSQSDVAAKASAAAKRASTFSSTTTSSSTTSSTAHHTSSRPTLNRDAPTTQLHAVPIVASVAATPVHRDEPRRAPSELSHRPQPPHVAPQPTGGHRDDTTKQTSHRASDAHIHETKPAPIVPQTAHKEPPAPPKLEGAKSLRDALAQVTGHQPPAPHARELKETLGKVAPEATVVKEAVKEKEEIKELVQKPAELPPEVLQSMLAVDELNDGSAQ